MADEGTQGTDGGAGQVESSGSQTGGGDAGFGDSGADGNSGGSGADGAAAGGKSPAVVLRKSQGGAFSPQSDVEKAMGKAVPATPSYQPNFKFKVLDKEHEFDEFLRGSIKDADTEKKVRDLYTRALGMDHAKQERESIKGEYSKAQEKIAQTQYAHGKLSEYVRDNDYDSFFEALHIPKEAVLKYAIDLAQRDQWTPQQQAQWQESRQTRQAADYYKTQNEQLAASQQQLSIQHREFELAQTLSRPEVSAAVQAYDTGASKPGAFRELVIRIGQAHSAAGKDIPAAQAVSEALGYLRAANPGLGAATTQIQNDGGQQQLGVVQPNQKPVIPAVQGRSSTPIKSTIKSLDDLKKRAREMDAQG